MKILFKNIEESKAEEMKKYKESIMKENEKIQIIKENLFMEYEDMRVRSANVYLLYSEVNKKLTDLTKENEGHIHEIEQLKNKLDNTELKRQDTQECLEYTEMVLSEYEELYNIQIESEKKMEKNKDDLDKQIRKLERDNKKKDAKLKEMAALEEKLKANQQMIEELQVANNRTFADVGSQTIDTKFDDAEIQTDLTASKIETIEKRICKCPKGKNKYLQAVKNYSTKQKKKTDQISNTLKKVEGVEGVTPRSDEKEDEDEFDGEIDEGILEQMRLEKEQKEAELKEKQLKREEEYTKRLKEKYKTKDEEAYTSLTEYQQKRQLMGESFTSGFDVKMNKQEIEFGNEKKKSESPKRQTLLDISPTSNRQIIEINANKEKNSSDDINFGIKITHNRNLNNSFINESGEDSYSKDENDIIRKPNIC